MKRFVVCICLLVHVLSVAACAGGGGMAGFATETTQIMNNAELIEQVNQLAEQIRNQIEMVNDMVRNTATIPDQIFGDVRQIYGQVKGVLDSTQGIAYTLGNYDDEVKRRWKSYGEMSKLSTVQDFSGEYSTIVDAQCETVRNTFEALGVSWRQFENDDTGLLRQLQAKAKSATGRNELIQSTNQLLGFLSEELMRLRQLQMLQAQQTAAAFEAERAREDLSRKRTEAFFEKAPEEKIDIPDKSLIEILGDQYGNPD